MFLVNGSSRWEYSGVKCVRTSGKDQVVPRAVTHNHFTDDKTETYKEVKYIFTKAGLLFLNVEFFYIFICDLEMWLYSAENCAWDQHFFSCWLSASNKWKFEFLGFQMIAWMLFSFANFTRFFGVSLIWLVQYKTGPKWKNMLFLTPHFST